MELLYFKKANNEIRTSVEKTPILVAVAFYSHLGGGRNMPYFH